MKFYAAYKGGKFLGKGTLAEVAEILGVSKNVVYSLSSPYHHEHKGPNRKWVEKLHDGLNEYALYRGEEMLTIGTVDELAEFAGVKTSTIRWLSTPSNASRRKPGGNHLQVIKLEMDAEDYA
ncbi:MAG: hypothetical protein WED82_00580 [Balneolales bacterium]